MTDLATVLTVYKGSNGDATKALYASLETRGPAGIVAVNLFRACKCSERAKVYRGRSYKGAAYDRKSWAMGNLVQALADQGDTLRLGDGWSRIGYGWGVDGGLRVKGDPHYHVLYVDLPTGQVSFHTDTRGEGPDYPGEWDGVRGIGAERICRWVCQVLAPAEAESAA